jgi:hypothetical protein
MKQMHLYVLLLVLITIFLDTSARTINKPLTRIPFEMVGTCIVMNVGINDGIKLHMLLDTGMGATILTEMSAEDSLTLNTSKQTTIKGLGPDKDLLTWISTGNDLLAGKLRLANQTIYALTENIFNLTVHTGYPIHGILGAELFENHVLRINYSKKTIQVYNTSNYKVPSNFTKIPLIMEGTKMYADIRIEDTNGQIRTVRMLIDTGAELAAWFGTHGSNPIPIPQKKIKGYIGKGLNGSIEGLFARMPKIWLGEYELKDAVVSFPDSASIADAFLSIQRDGTIGSQLLSRFELIFNQKEKALYVRPNYKFKQKFHYNMAGIEVLLPQEIFSLPLIYHVRQESSGALAGVLPGDQILEINGQNCLKIKLNEVKHYFETPNISLGLIVLRNGKALRIRIPIKSEL